VGGLRLTEVEIEKLAARGYAVERGVSLAALQVFRKRPGGGPSARAWAAPQS